MIMSRIGETIPGVMGEVKKRGKGVAPCEKIAEISYFKGGT